AFRRRTGGGFSRPAGSAGRRRRFTAAGIPRGGIEDRGGRPVPKVGREAPGAHRVGAVAWPPRHDGAVQRSLKGASPLDAQGVSRPGNSEGRAAGQAPKAAAGAAGLAGNGGSKPIPHLRWREAAGARAGQRTAELIVDGEPFLILGGELGNSSASSLEYVNAAWPRLRELHLNTVLAPVYWDLIEPEEGRFDFSLVDGLIAGAREHGMRLVLLWFGSWKNCMSCYVPAWIKTDPERFPRVRSSSGQAQEMLSAFYEDNAAADVRAFAALMRHLREADEAHRTGIMVQGENEIGMIPAPPEYSGRANRADQSPAAAEPN